MVAIWLECKCGCINRNLYVYIQRDSPSKHTAHHRPYIKNILVFEIVDHRLIRTIFSNILISNTIVLGIVTI